MGEACVLCKGEGAIAGRRCPACAPVVPSSTKLPRILSLREPWLWAMLTLGKDIENRTRNLGYYIGPVLLHRSKGTTWREVDEAFTWMQERGLCEKLDERWPGLDALEKPGIVARCRFVDLILPGGLGGRGYPSPRAARLPHQKASSRWYMGGWGYVVADVEPVPFVPMLGALGLFEPRGGNLERLRAARLV